VVSRFSPSYVLSNSFTYTFSMKRFLLLFVIIFTHFQLLAARPGATVVDTPRIWVSGTSNWSYNAFRVDLRFDIPYPRTLLKRITFFWGDGKRTDYFSNQQGFMTDTATYHWYQRPGTYRITMATIPLDSTQVMDTLHEISYVVRESYVDTELGNDTTMFEGDTLVLDARSVGGQYWWSTGETTQRINVISPGFYNVFVRKNGDENLDSLWVTFKPRERFLQARVHLDTLRCRYAVFSDSTLSSDPIVKRYWDFGDGTTDTTASPIHTYVADGNYLVGLTVINSQGDSAHATRQLSLYPPIIDLGRDTAIRPGEIRLLDATKPRFSEGATYFWSTGETTPAIYISGPGEYAVWARYCGRTIQDTIRLSSVPDALLRAGFSSLRTACATLQFTDTSKAGDNVITRRHWSFGDNTTDTAQHPAHTYAQAGNYTVRLVVTDNYGFQDSAISFITINPPLSVNLGPDSAQWSGRAILGYNIMPNPDHSYLWSTGDTTAAITVTQNGTYWLRITDRFCGTGVSDTIRLGVVATDTLLARIGIDSIRCNRVYFRDSSFTQSPIVKREWDFGDGTKDNWLYPQHNFANNGTYIVTLKVTNSKGSMDSVSRTVTVNNKPFVDLGADTALLPGDSLLLDASKPVYSPWATYSWSNGSTSPVIKVAAPGIYFVSLAYCGQGMADMIILTTLTDIGPATNVNANDSLAVTAQFSQPRNSDNVFTVQLLRESSSGGRVTEEGDVTDLMTVAGSSERVSLNVNIPDTIPCSDDYRIRVISSSPADTVAWSSKFEVVNMPPATVQQRGDSLFAGQALHYQWYLDDAPVADANTSSIRAKANGQYYVTLNNGGDCRSTSSPINMTITSVPDVNAAGSGVKAFPNPTDGIVYLRFEKPLLKPVRVAVHDTYGNTVFIKQIQDQTGQIDLSALPKGVYYLQITGYEKQRAMRIILQ
jgi:PKD repeat protein